MPVGTVRGHRINAYAIATLVVALVPTLYTFWTTARRTSNEAATQRTTLMIRVKALEKQDSLKTIEIGKLREIFERHLERSQRHP